MTVVIGILALIGLVVVGAIGWAFVHGVRDGLAAWREAPPGGTSQPVPVGAPPLSLSATLPSSYQAGQLAGESQPAGAPHTRRPRQLEQASQPVHPGQPPWLWAVS